MAPRRVPSALRTATLAVLAASCAMPQPQARPDRQAPDLPASRRAAVLACELPPIVPLRPERVPLTPCVNSPADEYLPRPSLDGEVLYVVRRSPASEAATDADEDVWLAPRSEIGWLPARRAPTPINNERNNFVVAARGDTLILGNVYRDDGGMEQGLSRSVLGTTGWSMPERVPMGTIERSARWTSYSISADGAVLLSHAELSGGTGGSDLYVRFREADGWGAPVELRALNTEGDEITPYLSEDGETLFFSSDGRGGRGQDVYLARRIDQGWTRWTTPVPLKGPANSAGFDGFFVPANERDEAYVASETEGGDLDIFRVARLIDVLPPDVASLAGTMVDSADGAPLEGHLVLARVDSTGIRPDTLPASDGRFAGPLLLGAVYHVRAAAPGYLTVEDTIRVERRAALERSYALRRVVEGLTLRLDVHFDTNRSVIRSESFPELDRAARMLAEHPTLRLEVGGHTDAVGSDAANQRLSEARARAVRTYLIRAGVEAERISARGYGEGTPVASNETAEGRALNRRVEVRLDRGS